MAGRLYVVGTPIGNLGDMSPRGREILGAVDFIAAEDTRVTLKLLNHFEIKKPMVSYYEHNLREKGEYILSRIMAGESCACHGCGNALYLGSRRGSVRLAAQAGVGSRCRSRPCRRCVCPRCFRSVYRPVCL